MKEWSKELCGLLLNAYLSLGRSSECASLGDLQKIFNFSPVGAAQNSGVVCIYPHSLNDTRWTSLLSGLSLQNNYDWLISRPDGILPFTYTARTHSGTGLVLHGTLQTRGTGAIAASAGLFAFPGCCLRLSGGVGQLWISTW